MQSSRALAIALLALLAADCTTLGKRVGEPVPDAIDRVTIGTTSDRQVVADLGPPTRMSALPDGMVMIYEYLDGTERQIGINLDFIALDFLKIAVGRGVARREVLVLKFDKSGNVQGKALRRWTDDVGRGGAVQLFFVAIPTVDSSYLKEPSTQHDWGQRMLRPLPATLNSAQDMASGEHGVELLGTPEGAGQRTLEEDVKRRRAR